MLILGLLLALFHFSTTSTRWWSNYLPISMWLFTLIAFAIITATTASAITVVIIIFSFLCFLVEPSCFGLLFHILSCNNLSYLKPSVPIAQNLLFLLFECKGNAFFLNISNNGMTKWWKTAFFWLTSISDSWGLDAGQLLSRHQLILSLFSLFF